MKIFNRTFQTTNGNRLQVVLTLDEFTGVFDLRVDKNHNVIGSVQFREPSIMLEQDHEKRDLPIIPDDNLLDSYEFNNLMSSLQQFYRREGKK